MEDLITAEEVAKILRKKPGTIANWRMRDYGPRWCRIGNEIRYKRSDVIAFIESCFIPAMPKINKETL